MLIIPIKYLTLFSPLVSDDKILNLLDDDMFKKSDDDNVTQSDDDFLNGDNITDDFWDW
jgi:hypothetical protein